MNLLKRMSIDLATIPAWATVDEAAVRMAAVGLSDLLVVDGYVLQGIITDSQIAAHRNLSCPTNGRTLVQNVMSRWVPSCVCEESERKLMSKLEMSPVGLLLVHDKERNILGVIRKEQKKTSARVETPRPKRTASESLIPVGGTSG